MEDNRGTLFCAGSVDKKKPSFVRVVLKIAIWTAKTSRCLPEETMLEAATVMLNDQQGQL
jgi:hypothetical protein